MQKMVEQRGLRAQLATGSLVTGQRYVALDYFPKSPKAHVDWSARRRPSCRRSSARCPSSRRSSAASSTSSSTMPLDAIGNDLKKALASLDETLRDARGVMQHFDADVVPALKSTLDDARGALGSAERMLTSTEANLVGPGAPGQAELRNAHAGARPRGAQPARAGRLSRTPPRGADPRQDRGAAAQMMMRAVAVFAAALPCAGRGAQHAAVALLHVERTAGAGDATAGADRSSSARSPFRRSSTGPRSS